MTAINSNRLVVRPAGLLTAVLSCLVLLGGCARDMSDLDNYISEVKDRPTEPIDPLPQIKPYETFEYTASELRDPFGYALIDETAMEEALAGVGSGPRPDSNRRREELERFELDSLDMVGTLELSEDRWGLVKDPDGLVHRVVPEAYLGRNHGRITAIHEDRIDLVELISNGSGGWLERDATIALDDT